MKTWNPTKRCLFRGGLFALMFFVFWTARKFAPLFRFESMSWSCRIRLKRQLLFFFPFTIDAANEPYELWEGMDRRSQEYKALKEERADALWKVSRVS